MLELRVAEVGVLESGRKWLDPRVEVGHKRPFLSQNDIWIAKVMLEVLHQGLNLMIRMYNRVQYETED